MTVYGTAYSHGQPKGGEGSCVVSEPEMILAMSERLLTQGADNIELDEVVYGGLLYPFKVAGSCCRDTPTPCAAMTQLLNTGIGIDCRCVRALPIRLWGLLLRALPMTHSVGRPTSQRATAIPDDQGLRSRQRAGRRG